MQGFPEEYLQRMRQMLGGDFQRFMACMEEPPVRGLRVNTLKVGIPEFLKMSPWQLIPSGIMPEGFVLGGGSERSIGSHPYHLAGLFYLQEPSAMSAAEELDPKPGTLVLDLCAAPGGKSGAAAARMRGKGILVSNETVPQRALTLSRTIERLGAVNTLVTNAHPELIAEEFGGIFDAVLVDAPCSGEGMFRKDETALKEWSPAHVKACAARQALILDSASLSLKPEGVMVYSTCTFSYEENEGTVETFLKKHPEFELVRTERLYPHTVKGEGHFTAKLVKKDDIQGVPEGKIRLYRAISCREESYHSFIKEVFEGEPSGEPVLLEDGRVIIIPEGMPQADRIRTVSLGVEAGRITKGRFEPSHTLALSAGNQKFRKCIELSGNEKELGKYLRGETLDAPSGAYGYYPVTYSGYALGWGKCVSGVLKNHLPKGLRLNK